MDNFTLIVVLNQVLILSALFTFVATGKNRADGFLEWRISSILILSGFVLLTLQRNIPPVLSIVTENYFILAGSFYQAAASLHLVFNRKIFDYPYPALLSGIFILFYIIYTYIIYNTAVRIIVISLLAFFIFTDASIILIKQRNKNHFAFSLVTYKLFLYFSILSFFYMLKIVYTIITAKTIVLLYQKDLVLSVSFLLSIIYQLSYTMTMFDVSLRLENRKLNLEKNKLGYLFSFLNNTARHRDINKPYAKIKEILTNTSILIQEELS